jgi:hypothetical protein
MSPAPSTAGGLGDDVERGGRAPLPRAEPVDAEPADDHHQPPLGIVDGGDVGAGQAGERLLSMRPDRCPRGSIKKDAGRARSVTSPRRAQGGRAVRR